MSLTLTWSARPRFRWMGRPLRPDRYINRSVDQASRTRLGVGNGSMDLGELFRVEGTGGDDRLTIAGDLTHVHGRPGE